MRLKAEHQLREVLMLLRPALKKANECDGYAWGMNNELAFRADLVQLAAQSEVVGSTNRQCPVKSQRVNNGGGRRSRVTTSTESFGLPDGSGWDARSGQQWSAEFQSCAEPSMVTESGQEIAGEIAR